MSIVGKIKTLFSDKDKTEALFPRTKVSAVSDDDGTGLNVLLDELNNAASDLQTQVDGKAPAGYGLGTNAIHVSDFNDATATGWYAGSTGTANKPFGYSLVETINRNDASILQIGYDIAETTSGYYAGWTSKERRCINGVWSDWKDRFAPAGYGLGGRYGESINDCNAAICNGWYHINGDTANCPVIANGVTGDLSTLFVTVRGSYVWQTLYSAKAAGGAVGNNLTLKRQSNDSGATWSEWEWVNPPMFVGVEYRTTERWNGKAVWTVWVYLGAIQAGKTAINTDFSASHVIRHAATKTTNAAPQHYFGSDDDKYGYWVNSNVYYGKISLEAFMGTSNSGDMYAQVWYTKD